MPCNFQTLIGIFLIVGIEIVFMVFFEKIILYMPGKFWYDEIFTISPTGPYFVFLETWGGILPPPIGLSALAVEAYGFTLVCSSVHPSVRPSATRYQEIRASDFSETWHKVAYWRKNSRLPPRGFLPKNPLFGRKMAF